MKKTLFFLLLLPAVLAAADSIPGAHLLGLDNVIEIVQVDPKPFEDIAFDLSDLGDPFDIEELSCDLLAAADFLGVSDEDFIGELSAADLIEIARFSGIDLPDDGLIAAADNLGPDAAGFLPEGDFGPDGDEYIDLRVMRDFIESRGLIQCRQKSGQLVIAADARATWDVKGEKANGINQRGLKAPTSAKAQNVFKSELNLFLDYTTGDSWVTTKLRWVNFDGKDGGTPTKVDIQRAFIGYDIRHVGKNDFYIELGRSRFNYIYESRIEFTSVFDGIHLFLTHEWPDIGQFTVHGGPFLVDSTTNHYGWIIEGWFTRMWGTGFSLKYNMVDWRRRAPTFDYGNLSNSGKTLIQDNPRYRYLVSQWLFAYETELCFEHCKKLYVYTAFLRNHDARASQTTNGRRLNNAWYAGFTLGKLCKASDWSVDLNYQSVQALAIPEFDLAGIGHGNAANRLISDAILVGLNADGAIGFTNYKGWQMSVLYALTDCLSWRLVGEYTTPRNASIGNDFIYKAFQMSCIYAF
ncbi:MAG: hypothetical protein H7A36_00170 [Chlamydiales bacterium]|nr:hypothetical protein [Chlamydiales bacterium]